ncbi:MAG: putative transcriptional regulator [Brevundimonas sp.]|jgi:putative transcriptional regulator|uniref:helix-turn-helix domain-containing protein n=1 Tax=Brevundimonas sp. TaxID=1871086 RepID=UPI0039E41CF9
MAVRVTLAVVMAKRGVRSRDLAQALGITEANMSLLKTGKVRGVRLDTLDALCRLLDCQPADILAYAPDDAATGQAANK